MRKMSTNDAKNRPTLAERRARLRVVMLAIETYSAELERLKALALAEVEALGLAYPGMA
jgi:hypothetical protein